MRPRQRGSRCRVGIREADSLIEFEAIGNFESIDFVGHGDLAKTAPIENGTHAITNLDAFTSVSHIRHDARNFGRRDERQRRFPLVTARHH